MNKASYTERPQRKYPLSTKGLYFIQEQILLAAAYAKAAGGNYILSGCEQDDIYISDGIVIINGELLPFRRGIPDEKVHIVQATVDVTAESVTYEAACTYRYVMFGSNIDGSDTFTWSDFQRLPTNRELKELIEKITPNITVNGSLPSSPKDGDIYIKTT